MSLKFLFSSVLTAVCTWNLVAAPEPGLLLYSSFDKYNTTPDYHASAQIKVGGIAKDLQLRMFPSMKDDGNSVCLNNKERITYSVPGNFKPDGGTVSFWVNLQNWSLSDTTWFNSLFEVSSAPSQYRFVIYKYRNHKDSITFYLQSGKHACSLYAKTTGWKKDTWHKIDVVWNQKEVKLYVDAKLTTNYQTKKLPAGMVLPKTVKGALITLNSQAGWRHNPAWITAYDELKIYDRCLTGEEIGKEYDKFYPRNFEVNIKPGKAVIPSTTVPVKIDGNVQDNEWKNATVLPVVNHVPHSQSHHAVTARAMLQYDKTNLYLAFCVDSPAYRHRVTARDKEIWDDDSVEFHVMGTDGKPRHFIFNANGAVYDSKSGKAAWDAKNLRAAGSHNKNAWSVEVAIPLAELGGKIGKNTILKGNFGSNNWKARTNYHSWNYIHGYLKGYASPEFFGDLIFGDPADSVQFIKHGIPEQGALELQLRGKPGMKANAEWQAETGASSKCNMDILKNTWSPELPVCRNIIRYSVQNGKEKEIYRTEHFVTVQQPFNMTYSARASKHLLLVDLSINKGIGAKTGKLRLLDPAGKDVAAKVFTMKKEQTQVTFPLPENLKENITYTLEATLGNLIKKSIFRMPDFTPFKKRVGIDNTIPAPWKPVTVKGKAYTAGNRTYTFDKGPFPVKITVDNIPVLSVPGKLLLNGTPVQWNSIIPGKNHGDHAEFKADGMWGNVKFTCRGEIWFDGMYRWDFSILPPKTGLDIKSLQMTWSVPANASKYILNPYYVPWKNKQAFLKWSCDERASLLWLTGTERGLAWWCKSDANWVIDPNKPQIKLKQGKGVTSVSIEMIQKSAILKKAADYTMIFQGTPPRKLDPSFRDLRYHAWRSGDTNCGVSGWNAALGIKDACNILHYTTLLPAYPQEYGKHYKRWKAKGVLDLAYSMPAHIGKMSPEYDYFYPEWAVTPGVKWGAKDEFTGERYYVEPCCAKTKGGDLQAYRADKLLQNYPDLGGIYFDISHVLSCDNPFHGCGGVDAFGKKFRSSTALSLREYFLRIYKITRKHKRALWLHAHNAYYPFVHDFADLWLPGEEQYFPVLRNPEGHYLYGISKEEYQSALNSAIRGVGIMMIPQNARVMGNSPELKKQAERFIGVKNINRLLTVLYLYDINLMAFRSGNEAETLYPFWNVRKKLHFGKAKFHGYWLDSGVKASVNGVYVSRYSWKTPMPYSHLLVTANYNKEAKTVSLNGDWKKLNGKWFDPVTDKALSGKTLLVPGEGFLLVGIK